MINEAVDNLSGCNRLLYEDAEVLANLEMECMKWLGVIFRKIYVVIKQVLFNIRD